MKMWVAYDDSPERLPIAIADSARELAEIVGAKRQTIMSKACDYKRGRTKSTKYACVEVEIQDEERE